MALNVEPDPMRRQANRLLDGIEDSQREHGGHHDALASTTGMMSLSQKALETAHAALVDQARVLHHQLGEHVVGMQEFTGIMIGLDDQARDDIHRAGGGQ